MVVCRNFDVYRFSGLQNRRDENTKAQNCWLILHSRKTAGDPEKEKQWQDVVVAGSRAGLILQAPIIHHKL
jgi:hypothetical protein